MRTSMRTRSAASSGRPWVSIHSFTVWSWWVVASNDPSRVSARPAAALPRMDSAVVRTNDEGPAGRRWILPCLTRRPRSTAGGPPVSDTPRLVRMALAGPVSYRAWAPWLNRNPRMSVLAARPPGRRVSNSITRWPARAASVAAMSPASPPPTTAMSVAVVSAVFVVSVMVCTSTRMTTDGDGL